ncbi:MAG: sigma-70 family RNA polymerase sigma factor [Anderseniella sp.]
MVPATNVTTQTPQPGLAGGKDTQAAHFANLLKEVADNRSRAAFGELFEHFGPRLKAFMMRKGASAELAEDLVQDAMVAVWNKAGMFSSGKGSVTTWIYTIARNLRIDRLRREGSRHFTDIDDYDAASDDPVSDEIVISRQQDDIVQKALAVLPDDQKQVIVMAFMDDMTQTEIAEKLDVPLGTVKSRMRLAYRKMGAVLEELK